MTMTDFKFLVDLFTTPQEKSFIADLMRDPDDESTKNAYVDYLKENGREASADLVKEGYVPGYRLCAHRGTGFLSGSGYTALGIPETLSGGYIPLGIPSTLSGGYIPVTIHTTISS